MMRKLTLQELKKINARGADYEGCDSSGKCCIKVWIQEETQYGRICGSYEWYINSDL